MRTGCDKLRERALRAGDGSVAEADWRAHARSCPDCRAEQFILETLQRQAVDERRHLGRREVAMLLQTARRRYPKDSAPAAWPVWLFRVACLFFIVGVVARFAPFPTSVSAPPGDGRLASNGSIEGLAGAGNGLVPAAPGETGTGTAPDAATGDEPAMEQRLFELRHRIDMRRRALEDLIERDLGEGDGQDALHISGTPFLAFC